MIIACDVDGVLADFSGGACAVHGKPGYPVDKWDWYKDWGLSDDEFWQPIKWCEDFYGEYVNPTPWKEELLGLLHSCGEVVLATANPQHPGLAASKTAWLNQHVPGVPVMMGNRKDLLAKSGRILVDDNDDNLYKWLDNGGRPIRLNQPWNGGKNRVDERIEQVVEHLQFYTGGVKAAA